MSSNRPVTELVSVEEYLSIDYGPDCDFVDGVLEDRHVGEKDHGLLQASLIVWFFTRLKELGIEVFPAQPVQISASRYRVPDLCVTLSLPDEQIFMPRQRNLWVTDMVESCREVRLS